MSEVQQGQTKRKRYKVGILMAIIVAGMFGFGYAMVPLYNVMCKALGINGKVGDAVSASAASAIDKTRIIKVQFITTNNSQIPWKFYPIQKTVKVHPGENKRVEFFAENDSNKTMTVQAIPSVTPGLSAKYLKKTECFCFNQQTLKSKESMKMPILFHIESGLPKNIGTVTLSYTLFDVTDMAHKNDNPQAGKISN